MFEIKGKQETLDLLIDFDKATGLPLYEEQTNILQIIKTYLALPYTIAEYGCGKKCSIIIRKLVDLGIPPYAIKRGMIMERDMSTMALEEMDARKRPHALIINNPLYHPKDFYQEVLLKMLEEKSVNVSIHKYEIHAGDYVLSHNKEVQFINARSHIFPIITFWDDKLNQTQEFILDPTLDQDQLVEVEIIREYLHDYEALIFTAPLLGTFRLDIKYLTFRQENDISELVRPDLLSELEGEAYAKIIRSFNGASEGSIGDPNTWTYANNIPEDDKDRHKEQLARTGEGDVFDDLFENMISSRERGEGMVVELRDELLAKYEALGILQLVKQDADKAEESLAPLAEAELIISYYRALLQLLNWQRKDKQLHLLMQRDFQLKKVLGISKRIRYRLDKLAKVSRDHEFRIDARALNDQFIQASIETIRQMNLAGLEVFIDKVGNIHGLLLSASQKELINKDITQLKKISYSAICHCSHIDTVKDGGMYDGRLGVLSGIETAHILYDLKKYFHIPFPHERTHSALMVSSFVGEEMTFTGQGVSMPGSSAVAGHHDPEEIYLMKNNQEETYYEKLIQMLLILSEKNQQGHISLHNHFLPSQSSEQIIEACIDPTYFFSPHTYERHIEQGPVLDQRQIPLVLVDTIMGIHQEDFILEGEEAEKLALQINFQLRQLALKEKFQTLRVTVGIMEGNPECIHSKDVDFAIRCNLYGEKNHAGATLMQERRDPGVAAARVAEYFTEYITQLNEKYNYSLIPLIGDLSLIPGTNRNVIPGSASLSLGISNSQLTPSQEDDLVNQLHAWIIHTLHPRVSSGGEGIFRHKLSKIDYMNVNTQVRLAIDVRADTETIHSTFLDEVKAYLASQVNNANIQISPQVHQKLRPYPLHTSGQVLQIERSYGGSHNPNEAQLDHDLLRGSLIQLEVTLQFLQLDNTHINLYQSVKSLIPSNWRVLLPRFISGALHDTCNIAGKILQLQEE